LFSAVSALSAFLFVTGCGKKGPPLPPLVKLPVAPVDLTAERHGDTIDLQFTVPTTNTDGTRPANVASVDVYAITAPVTARPLTDQQVLKFGTKVASLAVKSPRDPNLTAEPDDPDEEVEPPEGRGLDQGAIARVAEPLTEPMLDPVDLPKDKEAARADAAQDDTPRPLLGPPPIARSRMYAAIGLSSRGRKGPLSKRILVPLVPPPPPPSAPSSTYDEKAVTVRWLPPDGTASPAPADANNPVLPSRPVGVTRPTITYNVYDATTPASVVKLTKTPIAELRFSDPRIVWGEKRCYVVRSAETIGGLTIESDAVAAPCQTLTDTFPPAAPQGLKSVGSEGAINLIWDANTEADLDGYILLRAIAPNDELAPVTPSPIRETAFQDRVPAGVRYVYALEAVDKAGNASQPSERIEETAR
jgi:predicted small lipoprotein YifL